MFSELVIEPLSEKCVSNGEPIKITDQSILFAKLTEFCKENKAVAWINLIQTNGIVFRFFQILNGSVIDRDGKKVNFYQNEKGALCFSLEKEK